MRNVGIWLLVLAAGALFFSALRMFADEKPKEKPTKELAKEFVYPGAKKFDEDREGARMYQAKLTTADDADKVSEWYRKTLGFQGGEGIAFNPGNQPGIRESVADDSRQPGREERSVGEPRPLSLRVFVKKTNDIVIVAVVSRGKDEKLTHVAMTFLDNKDQ
jgi:hypothetical protein